MPLFLSERDPGLREYMDDPDCDLEMLHATYRQFETVNRLIGGWNRIYKTHIRPALIESGDNASILDIGCGGGDILRLLNGFCRDDNLSVRFTGIEPDTRAIEFINKQRWPDNFIFLNSSSDELVQQNESFTVVISNHLIHHLTPQELNDVCRDAEFLTDKCVVFSDIERSFIGYSCFRTIAPLLFKNSFIVADGLRSIRRSYQRDELTPHLPDGWNVERQFPFRLQAIYKGGNS